MYVCRLYICWCSFVNRYPTSCFIFTMHSNQEDNLFPLKNKMYRYSVKMTYNRNIYYLIIKEWKNSEFVWTLKNKSFLTDSTTYRDMVYSFLNTKKYIPCFHPSNKELPSLTCRLEKQKIAVKIQTLFATITTFLKVF